MAPEFVAPRSVAPFRGRVGGFFRRASVARLRSHMPGA
jgi:hypothetical protein